MRQFRPEDIESALTELSMLKYFPGDSGTRAAIGALLARIVPHLDALQWLTRAYVDRIGQWHGPMELRAILCRRYAPADGVEAHTSLPGWTAAEAEAEAIEQHLRLKAGSGDYDEAARKLIAGIRGYLQ